MARLLIATLLLVVVAEGLVPSTTPACSQLADPSILDTDSISMMIACESALEAQAPVNRDIAGMGWLAARARRATIAGLDEAADSVLDALFTMLRATPTSAGIQRVDAVGKVAATECLPIWRVIEADRGEIADKNDQEAALRLASVAKAHRELPSTRRLARGRSLSQLTDDDVLDIVSEESKMKHCDSALVQVPGGRWYDVVAPSSDDRWSTTAHDVPLHGWLLTDLQMFVPETLNELCTVSEDDVHCLLAGHDLPADADAQEDATAASSARHLAGSHKHRFSSIDEHSIRVGDAFAKGRRLAFESFSSETRSRGNRSRVYFVVDFPDKKWDINASEVFSGIESGIRETEAKFSLMSYGQWKGVNHVHKHILTTVNTTYAELMATGSAGKLKDAAEWILEHHSDPSKRIRISDWDYLSVTFPSVGSYSWAGLAHLPGTFVWLQGGYRGAAYAVIHENGHNVGLAHAGLDEAGYGNQNDNMGCCKRGQWFTQRKAGLHWLPRGALAEVAPAGPTAACPTCSRGGNFMIWPHDIGKLPPQFDRFVSTGGTLTPQRSDTGPHATPAQPGGIAVAVYVAENPIRDAGVANGKIQLWIDAKAEQNETGAGQMHVNLGKTSSSTASQSGYQPTRSRTAWSDSAIQRGDAFVVYGDRISTLAGGSPIAGDSVLEAVSSGTRPALLIQSFTENDAPAYGMMPPTRAGVARAMPGNMDAASNYTSIAIGMEPMPLPVPDQFGPTLTTRDVAAEDHCFLGPNASSTNGRAFINTARCSSLLRPTRMSFLGPSGEHATVGIGCDPLDGSACQRVPLHGQAAIRLRPSAGAATPPQHMSAAVQALATELPSMTYLGTWNGKADAPHMGFTPQSRFMALLGAETPESLVAIVCARVSPGPARITPLHSDQLFVAAYSGAYPPYEIISAGANPESAGGPLAWSNGAASSLSVTASQIGVQAGNLSALCVMNGQPAAGVAALSFSTAENAVSTRVAAMRALAAEGGSAASLNTVMSASTHGLTGSSLPSMFLVAGAMRNNLATTDWHNATRFSAHDAGMGIDRLSVSVSLFRVGATAVDTVELTGGSVLKGTFVLSRADGMHNGRFLWRRGKYLAYWTGSKWRVSEQTNDGWYWEQVTPNANDITIFGLDGVGSRTVKASCPIGFIFAAGKPVGPPPHPVNGSCTPCPAGLGSLDGVCVCPVGSQPTAPGSAVPCQLCPAGSYKNAAGNVACTSCPSSGNTAGTGASSDDACGKSADDDFPFSVTVTSDAEAAADPTSASSGEYSDSADGGIGTTRASSVVGSAFTMPTASASGAGGVTHPSQIPGNHGWCRLLYVQNATGRTSANTVWARQPGVSWGARPVYGTTTSTAIWLRSRRNSPTLAGGEQWVFSIATTLTEDTWWRYNGEPTSSAGINNAPYIQAVNTKYAKSSQVMWKTRHWWDRAWEESIVNFDCICADDDPFANTMPNVKPCIDPSTITIPGSVTVTHSPQCEVGYKETGGSCVDVDECAITPAVCGSLGCTNSIGSYSCGCPAGTASSVVAKDVCIKCPSGTYGDSGVCVPCPAGTSSSPGASSVGNCSCVAGTFRAAGAAHGAPCVQPDTSVLRLPGAHPAVLISAPAFLPEPAASISLGLGLNGIVERSGALGASPIGSVAHAALAASSASASAPLLWGRGVVSGQANSMSASRCLPSATGPSSVAPWWIGHATASLSGYTMDPSDTGVNALARQAGLIAASIPKLVRASETAAAGDLDGDGPSGQLPAGVGSRTDLAGFAMYGGGNWSRGVGCGGADSFVFAPSRSERMPRSARAISAKDVALKAASGAGKAVLDAVVPRIALIAAQGRNPSALENLLFARPAAAARQPFDGAVLAVGTTPHDDGRRVAAAIAPHSTATMIVSQATSPGWQPTSIIPASLASGQLRVFNATTQTFELATRDGQSVNSVGAFAAERSSPASAVGLTRGSAVVSDLFAGPACVALAGPGGLAHAACGGGKYLANGCTPAIDETKPATNGQLAVTNSKPNTCASCTVCSGAMPLTIAPCSALADTVCGAAASADDCSVGTEGKCGANGVCGKCQAGAWCQMNMDCAAGLECVRGSGAQQTKARTAGASNLRIGICLPIAAGNSSASKPGTMGSVVAGRGGPGSIVALPLRQGQIVAIPIMGQQLTALDFASPMIRRAMEKALRWSVRARVSGRADALVQLVSVLDVDTGSGVTAFKARLKFLEAALGMEGGTKRSVNTTEQAKALMADGAANATAGLAAGDNRAFSAADALGISPPSASSTRLLPALDGTALVRSASAATKAGAPAEKVVALIFRIAAIAPRTRDGSVRSSRLRARNGVSPRELSSLEKVATTAAAAQGIVRRAAAAAATDVSLTGSLPSLARGFLRANIPIEASLASRMHGVIAGSNAMLPDITVEPELALGWEAERISYAFEADEAAVEMYQSSLEPGCEFEQSDDGSASVGVICGITIDPTASASPTSAAAASATSTPAAASATSSPAAASASSTPAAASASSTPAAPSATPSSGASATSSPAAASASSTPAAASATSSPAAPSATSTPAAASATSSPAAPSATSTPAAASASSTPAATTSSTPTALPSPSTSSLPVNCALTAPSVSNCTSDCGSGGYQYTYRKVLTLPQHGGTACPAQSQLVSRDLCPATIVAFIPPCPVNDPCPVAEARCGATSPCGLCAELRTCSVSADCKSTSSNPLVCRTVRSTSTRTSCLKPLASPAPGQTVRPALEDSMPSLTGLASGSSTEKPTSREATTNDQADGIVVQLELAFNSLAPFRNFNVVQAMKEAIRRLVLGLGLPASATVRVTFSLSGDQSSRRRLGSEQQRLLQSSSGGAVASIGIDLNDTSTTAGSSTAATSIAAASNLAATVTNQLADNTGNVVAAVQTAIIEEDTSASDVNITIPQVPVFAVVAASDGAVLAASASVLAAIQPTPTPSASPAAASPAASPSSGGTSSILPMDIGIIGGAIGGAVGALLLFCFGYAACRRCGLMKRRQHKVSGGATSPTAREIVPRSG